MVTLFRIKPDKSDLMVKSYLERCLTALGYDGEDTASRVPTDVWL